jgi:hypothetical protein
LRFKTVEDVPLEVIGQAIKARAGGKVHRDVRKGPGAGEVGEAHQSAPLSPEEEEEETERDALTRTCSSARASHDGGVSPCDAPHA